MEIDEKAKRNLLNNLIAKFNYITCETKIETDIFPMTLSCCYFCLKHTIAYSSSCEMCEYGKRYGICYRQESKFDKISKEIKKSIESLKKETGYDQISLGDCLAEKLRKIYEKCILKIGISKTVNEIMLAKKELLVSIAKLLFKEISIKWFSELPFIIENNYWDDEGEKVIKKIMEIKVSDLIEPVKTELKDLGYKDTEVISKVEPKYVSFGQIVEVDNWGKFYLIRTGLHEAMLLSEDHTTRMYDPIVVNIHHGKILYKDLSKLTIGKKFKLIDITEESE